ncbi:MAG: lipo-like protein [Opitutaceae bacterium]|nr:lipo-like protein [Opitutaceae bacterium]|tara:strand:+ start:3218 stop:3637 length:420 start_codon:yes stop_codon:yes gene_type:complete
MKSIVFSGCIMMASLMLAGCASDRSGVSDTRPMLTGTVNYRVRIALSPSAVMTVRLLDVTQKEAPAIVLGEKSISNPGNSPISFSLAYPFGGISPSRNYVIDARIELEGRLRFYAMEPYVVTPQNAADPHAVWLQLTGD